MTICLSGCHLSRRQPHQRVEGLPHADAPQHTPTIAIPPSCVKCATVAAGVAFDRVVVSAGFYAPERSGITVRLSFPVSPNPPLIAAAILPATAAAAALTGSLAR